MRHGKRITLTNSYLINLRLNLRKIIVSAYDQYSDELHEEIMKISKALKKDYENDELHKKRSSYRKKKRILMNYYNDSIIRCGTCNTIKGDRIYHKKYEEWYCPKCYSRK